MTSLNNYFLRLRTVAASSLNSAAAKLLSTKSWIGPVFFLWLILLLLTTSVSSRELLLSASYPLTILLESFFCLSWMALGICLAVYYMPSTSQTAAKFSQTSELFSLEDLKQPSKALSRLDYQAVDLLFQSSSYGTFRRMLELHKLELLHRLADRVESLEELHQLRGRLLGLRFVEGLPIHVKDTLLEMEREEKQKERKDKAYVR